MKLDRTRLLGFEQIGTTNNLGSARDSRIGGKVGDKGGGGPPSPPR